MRLYIYILLLPLLGFGSSQLWSAQNKSTMTENQKAIYTQLQSKKQELAQLLKSNNLSANALTKEQQQIILAANKILKTYEAPQDIGRNNFIKDFENHINAYRSGLLDYINDKTPILGAKFKQYLSGKMVTDSYNINLEVWKKAVEGIPDHTLSRGEIANLIMENLLFYTKDDNKEIKVLVKNRRTNYPKLNKRKTLNGVLPNKETFVGALSSDFAEDKKSLDHEGAKEFGASRTEYTTLVQTWAKAVVDTLSNYKSERKIIIEFFLKDLEHEFSRSEYDTVIKSYVFVVIKNVVAANIDEKEATGSECAGVLISALQQLQNKEIEKYYVYESYENFDLPTLSGRAPYPPLADNWLIDAEQAGNPLDTDYYKEFQDRYAVWAKDVIQQIGNIKDQDTIFHMEKYRASLSLFSSNYGDKDPLMNSVLYDLQFMTSNNEKGILLVDFIERIITTISDGATFHNIILSKQWKEHEVVFHLDFGNRLARALEDAKAAASFSEFKSKVDTWATTAIDLLLKTKGISKKASFNTADLKKELGYLFNGDIDGIKGVDFIYQKYLLPKIPTTKKSIQLQELNTIWNEVMQQVQQNNSLKEPYNSYIQNYYPLAVEHLIDSLEFILPTIENLEAVLKSCQKTTTSKKLNVTGDRTIAVNYTIEWQKRKTLVEVVATEVHKEVPFGDNLQERIGQLGTWIDSKLPNGVSTTIENLIEQGGDVIAFTARTRVPNDTVQVTLPLRVNKTYQNGKSIVFFDIEELSDGNISLFKDSVYSLSRVSISKQRKTIFDDSTARHYILVVLDVDDLAVSKALSAELGAGAEVSADFSPKKYPLHFEIVLESTYQNGNLSMRVTEEGRTPTAAECELIDEVTRETNELMNIPAFR